MLTSCLLPCPSLPVLYPQFIYSRRAGGHVHTGYVCIAAAACRMYEVMGRRAQHGQVEIVEDAPIRLSSAHGPGI